MLKEGLYLEEKNSTVGVASTSRNIVLRSMWVTRQIDERTATLQLLDDKGQPTAYIETLTVAEIDERMIHRPLKPEVWAALKKKCQEAKPMNPPKPKAEPPAQLKKKGNWWDT